MRVSLTSSVNFSGRSSFFRFVMRFPKRSISIISASISVSEIFRGRLSSNRTKSVISAPNSSGLTPCERCAATGAKDDLVYVSPKSGRAVSAAGGADYKDRLLTLPGFLLKGRQGTPTLDDVVAGIHLTGHFLEARVLIPRDEAMPAARVRFTDLIVRRATDGA